MPIGPLGVGGSDPDTPGNEPSSYELVMLPNNGTLYLGDPSDPLNAITSSRTLTPAQLSNLVFVANNNFPGDTFTYRAIDAQGEPDPTPATVTLNAPPDTDGAAYEVPLGNPLPLTGSLLGGSDPDAGGIGSPGDPVSFIITRLPDPTQGVLYLGDPAVDGQRLNGERPGGDWGYQHPIL